MVHGKLIRFEVGVQSITKKLHTCTRPQNRCRTFRTQRACIQYITAYCTVYRLNIKIKMILDVMLYYRYYYRYTTLCYVILCFPILPPSALLCYTILYYTTLNFTALSFPGYKYLLKINFHHMSWEPTFLFWTPDNPACPS